MPTAVRALALLCSISLNLWEAERAAAASSEPARSIRRDELAGIESALAAKEYEASQNGTGLQAPNRAHNLRTYFEATGIRVHDRTAEGSPELVGLSVTGVGRGAALSPVPPGDVSREGARVEIRREGLVEWYLNSAEGLEQGFTLAARPAGEGPLVLELALSGATASKQGDGLVFATRAGRRLAYSKLVVTDASARTLPAILDAPAPGRVRIMVEDAGAVYPLVIDPLLTETADAQLESDQADASFGVSVADAGDVNGDGYSDVIVGALDYDAGQTNEGAAFVFLGSAAGLTGVDPGTSHAQLESNQDSSAFGISVAGAGDVNGDGYADVIVGASNYDAGESNEGAAFVFHGSASGIASGDPTTADAQLESDQGSAQFGASVASAGDVNGDGYADVIIGASGYDAGQSNEGAAFVFHGSAAGIGDGDPGTAHAQLESNQILAVLGGSVAGAGDVNGDGYADVIVGAILYDAGTTDEGAAFVFLGSASGVADGDPGNAHAQLESNQNPAQFGSEVAPAGDVNGDGYADVIVAAPNYTAGQSNEGAAFVFLGSSSGIADGNPTNAHARLEANQATAVLGSVAGGGDVNGDGYADVIVGARLYDSGQTDEGIALVFLGGASGIANGNPGTAYASLEADQGSAGFGGSVALGDVNGDGYADAIVGARNYSAGESGEGAAFVYHGGAQGILDGNPATAAAQLETNQANAAADPFSPLYYDALDVAGAGDVNGDGYADVILGAPYYDSGQTDEGAAFVFLGSASGIANGNPTTAATRLESDQAGAQLGRSVAGAGDVNGDGYGDVIVGAWQYDADGQTNAGAAFVFFGSASGIANGNPATAAARLESDQADAFLGESVAGAGDTNGDGYADVIVGARYYDAGQSDEGAAFVFLGGASGIADGSPTTAAAQLESDQADATLGFVASAGDVNGDGFADVLVGAVQYDAGQTDEGAAFVFLGGATGIADGSPATAATQLEADQATVLFGIGSGAGDVNGDGYADVIVGAPQYDAGQTDEGAAFVFHGSETGIADGSPATAAAQLEANQASAIFGFRAAGAGDVNGDGYADVIVGAIAYDAGQTNEGAAFVFLGSASGVADGNPATAEGRLESNQLSSPDPVALGWSVAGAGDVNGDGYADVIVGTPYYDAGQVDEGVAFVFYGGGNRTGRRVLARQLRSGGGSLPVQPWGTSDDADDFQVRATATHPSGRGRVKLQVQACPNGVPFGHASCTNATSSNWTDVTATSGGVTLTQTVAGLADGVLYRWRARVLHAPFGVTQSGITAPPNPAHGPWRRLFGQAFEADVRIPGDGDEDGLPDLYETDTGSYVSPTDTGSDPNDPDSDDDGLLDGAEVALGANPNDPDSDDDGLLDGAEVALGTDPNDPDTEDDGDLDGADNCPLIVNANQANGDTWGAGDACQCGDVTGDGVIAAADYQLAREHVVKGTALPAADRCDVTGDAACDVEDLAVLERLVNLVLPPPPGVDGCDAYTTP